LPEGEVLALCFGRFSVADKMDLLPLLDAWHRATAKSGRKPLLLLAGEDRRFGYAEAVRGAIRDLGLGSNVRVWANPPEAAKPLLYAAADLFVSVSDNLQESFGITVVEAMATGLPVVCSDWNGYRDLVVDGKTGYLIPTYWGECTAAAERFSALTRWQDDHLSLAQTVAVDTETLALRLHDLLSDRGLRRRLGKAARNRAETRFSWRRIARQYQQLYDDLWERCDEQSTSDLTTSPMSSTSSLGQARYFDHFNHYASRMVLGVTRLRLTDRGVVLRGDEDGLKQFWEQRYRFARPDVLKWLVEHIHPDSVVCAAEVVAAAQADLGTGREAVLKHLLWMCKHGMISFTEDD
jgi:hypothetical protein